MPGNITSNKNVKKTKDITYETLIGGKTGVLKLDNKDYKIEVKGKPECTNACPAGINVKAYINLIANKRFEEAIEVIRRDNPFPAICGRVCTRPCEESCEQAEKGDSVSIRALKRYASDYELARRPLDTTQCKQIYKEKIAIIGAGPAGLTAAVDLIRLGYPVTVFESENEPGGMLRYAIPPYRLPDRTLKREIDWIKELGIKIKTRNKIDDPSKLLKQGYSAVLIAEGSSKTIPLGIPGEDAEGVIDPLHFLKSINTKKPLKISGNIVVIGGGSTAFDAARSAIRLKETNVTIAYRRSISEMPADKEEIKEAKEEAIKIQTLVIPKKIIIDKNKIIGIELIKTKLGEPDISGRRRPIPIHGSEYVLKADYIIPAIGTKPNIKNTKITDSKGKIIVKNNLETKIKGIYAAGDVETGPSSVVEVIGRGHIAAKAINSFLKGQETNKQENKEKNIPIVLDTPNYSKQKYTIKQLEKNMITTSFEEVEKTLYEYEAVEEASRCFTCGPCYECEICLPNCSHKQVSAKIEDTTFLLKVPQEISYKITEAGPIKTKIKTREKNIEITLNSLTVKVDSDLCIGCGRCEEVCSYRAICTTLSKDKQITAEVNQDSCASCSACISACPTGAITQGYMSDENILTRLKGKKTPYNGIKALVIYWNTTSNNFEEYDGITEIMSERKISPQFLIRALSRCGKGLLIIGPDEKTGSHYLPWEEHIDQIINDTKKLLKLVGISPVRIQYKKVEKQTNPTQYLKEFSQTLEKKKLSILQIPHPKIKTTPLAETITLLRIMGANPDIKPFDEDASSPLKKQNKNAFFEACLPMLDQIGNANKLYDIHPTRKAIKQLLEKTKISDGIIENFTCPSKGLIRTKADKIQGIIIKIAEKNLKTYKKIQSKKLILATPESYNSFSQDENYKNIVTLTSELLKKLEITKDFSPVNKTIALHKACSMKQDPFYEDTKKLLKLIPGVKIIDLKENKCEHNGFENLNAKSKQSAIKLLKEAVEKGAEIIVCTSPFCESHLLLAQREGSWNTVDIKISDIYRILTSSIEGDAE